MPNQPNMDNVQNQKSRTSAFISNISPKIIASAGRLLGIFAYVFDWRHRRIVRRNLQFTHPDWSQNRIRQLSRHIFQSMSVTFLEMCQMACFSSENILARVRIRGEENLLNAAKGSKGVIMITAHLGNWEMAALFVCCYLQEPVVSVAKKIRPGFLDKWIQKYRSRFGNIILDKKGALPGMVRMLRQGKILGILIDQETRKSEGVKVNFFGRSAYATPVAALLAQRYGYSILPAFCIREADGGLALVVEPPLSLQNTEDSRADLQENTQVMTDAIEKAIREYPEQWFWFHKRWKRHYPKLYPEDLTRRRRRREKRRARSKQSQLEN